MYEYITTYISYDSYTYSMYVHYYIHVLCCCTLTKTDKTYELIYKVVIILQKKKRKRDMIVSFLIVI